VSTVSLSDALADWMEERGATDIRLSVDEDANGLRLWSAAIVCDNHLPGCRGCVEVLDTSKQHATVWGAIIELAYERQPVSELDAQDWGRLGSMITSGGD